MSERFEVVKDDCIGCGLCSERAPENFEIPAEAPTARVFKQPENSEEERACLEAGDYCPTGGIRSGPLEAPSVAPPSAAGASGDIPVTRPFRTDTPPVGTPLRRLED